MSDQTPDRLDDLLRAALRDEAEAVTAAPELLDRIRAVSRHRRPGVAAHRGCWWPRCWRRWLASAL